MQPQTRRQFLVNSAAIAAAGAYAASEASANTDTGNKPGDSPKLSKPSASFGQGIMVGEVTDTSVILQARVTLGAILFDGSVFDDGDALRDGDLPGVEAEVTFALTSAGDAKQKNNAIKTLSAKATADNDYIARVVFTGLNPGERYGVTATVTSRKGDSDTQASHVAGFKTLPGKDASVPISFVMTSCMNYDKYIGNEGRDGAKEGAGGKGYKGEDRALGYPSAASVFKLSPDFVFFAGDVVYYDRNPKVKTLSDMRAKWHRQYNFPRLIELTSSAPGYYLKDDHDFRDDDADNEGVAFPPPDLGIKTFREQCPILPQGDDKSPTYRTHRVSKDLQVWMLEGRDYRSPNKSPDTLEKTVWGHVQEAWLKKTLLESDATYRVIISPTPMVGPDDARKSDNHTNLSGFQAEGKAFKNWGKENQLWGNTFLICGDRHWQYHSVDPTGAHEFSCGAFNDENSRLGRKPGDKGSTDPEALVTQHFTSPKPKGGFLRINIDPQKGGAKVGFRVDYHDDLGNLLYTYTVK